MARNNGGKTIAKSPARYMLSGLARNKGVTTFALILTVISTLLVTIPSVIIGMAVNELLQADGITPALTLTPLFMTFVWLIIGLALLYMWLYFIVGYVWAILTLRW